MERWTWWFLGLVLLSILLKIPALDAPLAEDEAVWAKVIYHGTWEERFARIPHPPLAMLLYVGAHALGLPIKLVPLIFASAAVLLLYFSLQKLHNSKTAFMASTIILITPLFTIGSLQLDIDGGILLMFTALLFFIEVRAKRLTQKVLWFSIVSGLMLLTKYTAALIFLPFWIKMVYDAFYSKKISQLLTVFSAGLASLFIGALFPLVSLFTRINYFNLTRSHGLSKLLNFEEFSLVVIFLVLQVVLLLGPLLLHSMMRIRKVDYVSVGVITMLLLFYLVIVTTPGRPLERYLVPLLIPLGLLIASVKMNFTRTWIWAIGGFMVFFMIDIFTKTIIPFSNKFAYFTSGILFLVPFRGASGPFGFYVSSLVLIVGVALAFGAWRNYSWAIGLMLAVTLLINAEALYAIGTPDTSSAKQLLDPIDGNLLSHRGFGIERFPHAVQFWDSDLYTGMNISNATVILLNFPPHGETLLQRQLSACVLEKEVVSRNVLIGQRFLCT